VWQCKISDPKNAVGKSSGFQNETKQVEKEMTIFDVGEIWWNWATEKKWQSSLCKTFVDTEEARNHIQKTLKKSHQTKQLEKESLLSKTFVDTAADLYALRRKVQKMQKQS